MAEFNLKRTVKEQKDESKVVRCNLVNLANRPSIVAFASVNYEGKLFLGNIAVTCDAQGTPFLRLPAKKRTRGGEDVLDRDQKPIYDEYYSPADKETREHLEQMVFTAVQDALDGIESPKKEKGEEKVIVNLAKGDGPVVAFVNVVVQGKFLLNNIVVNQVLQGEKQGEGYLTYPSRKRMKNGADVLDENGKPVYDNYYGPATAEDNHKLTELVCVAVQAEFEKNNQ